VLCLTATERRATARAAGVAATAPRYGRHAPERKLLHALVQARRPDFKARPEAEDRSLPGHMPRFGLVRADGIPDRTSSAT